MRTAHSQRHVLTNPAEIHVTSSYVERMQTAGQNNTLESVSALQASRVIPMSAVKKWVAGKMKIAVIRRDVTLEQGSVLPYVEKPTVCMVHTALE